jgi:hypothetical protein
VRERTWVREVVMDEHELIVGLGCLLMLREWGGGFIAGVDSLVADVVVCACVVGRVVVGVFFQGGEFVG